MLCVEGFQEISVNDFHLSLDDYSLILDVRTTDEFKSGHVPNAVNISLQELNKESIRFVCFSNKPFRDKFNAEIADSILLFPNY